MKILIAEDDALFRRTLEELLLPAYELQVAAHGDEAWALLQRPDPPKLAILDWVMPGFSGPQLCRKIRSSAETSATYIILLTSRNSVADIVSGLHSGADDYVTKPFDPEELRARVRVGERVLNLQSSLSTKLVALENALVNAYCNTFCPSALPVKDIETTWSTGTRCRITSALIVRPAITSKFALTAKTGTPPDVKSSPKSRWSFIGERRSWSDRRIRRAADRGPPDQFGSGGRR